MSQQDEIRATSKRRRNHQTSKPNTIQAIVQQRPANDDKEAWKAHWRAQGQPWRTKPEIDIERQKYLTKRRTITPHLEQNIYPFKGIKLSCADVEWLLATHENGRGPIDWSDEKQREREGLDLRGADLHHEDLRGLPLIRLRGGLTFTEWYFGTEQERSDAAAQMEKANFTGAQLDGAIFGGAQLQGTDFHDAQLQGGDLTGAQLRGANFTSAHLWRAMLSMAHLEGAIFGGTKLQEANLKFAKLNEASFIGADLTRADVSEAQLEKANLNSANLEGTFFNRSHLEKVDLRNALLKGTHLNHSILGDKHGTGPRLADAQWDNMNLSVVDWSQVRMLDDEFEVRQKPKNTIFSRKDQLGKTIQLEDHQAAVRANRQLAVALQNQGMNEQAARFTYHAQLMQRKVYWLERKIWQYLFSLFLDLLAGYGYKPWKAFIAYLIVILAFATAYFIIGHKVGPILSPLSSIVFSMTSFHGRGFFPGGITLDDPLTVLAALEAFVGLLIEATFIATLTQRLFGK